MSEELDILFDPEEDGRDKPTLLGTFPAHITGYKEGNNVRGSVPYNVSFKIAPEAEGINAINWREEKQPGETDEDFNERKEIPADYMIGREVRSVGIWLNPQPKPEERWKNRDYVNFLEAIGVELEEIEKDGRMLKKLVAMEEQEVIGRPCLVTIKLERDKRPEHTGRVYPKVFTVQQWNDGERIDVTEDEEDVFATTD